MYNWIDLLTVNEARNKNTDVCSDSGIHDAIYNLSAV